MGLLDKFKKAAPPSDEKPQDEVKDVKPAEKVAEKVEEVKSVEEVKKAEQPKEPKKEVKKKQKGTGEAYRYIIKPLISEKASHLSAQNKYVFEIAPKANKIEIKRAIKALYNVEPVKVNVINVRGKSVRYGRSTGMTKCWKKAIITLKPGDKIEVYEGV